MDWTILLPPSPLARENNVNTIRLLDFSSRLPGPWAAHQLAQMPGVEVIRLELAQNTDPFYQGIEHDASFPSWQKQFAREKKIHRFDWHGNFEQSTCELIAEAQGMIFAPATPPELTRELRKKIMEQVRGAWVMIELGGQRNGHPWHDLNALAQTGLLQMHTAAADDHGKKSSIAPPFIPVAGIVFGMRAALEMSWALSEAQAGDCLVERTIYLQDVVEEMATTFIPSSANKQGQALYLHNGLFPCYRLYRLKDDSMIAMAAIEQRFWRSFLDQSALPLTAQDRFDESGRVRTILENYFGQITLAQLSQKMNLDQACISVVRTVFEKRC
jgi:crotonobetainyl-CoA:carnitine CoA-transferase CaiB-like acyl-CoA transferase